MKKICELFDRLSNQFHDERNDCEYSANYDNEKKIWKFIKKLEANNYRLINLSEDNDYDYWSEE